MEEKPKILIVLENFYGYRKNKFKIPVYDTRIINRKNATYSRLLSLEEHFELWFTETTPEIADNKDTKFPVDLKWVKSAIDRDSWFAIIACGKTAGKALDDLKVEHKKLPHPVSRLWRRYMIDNLKNNLIIEKDAI
ncbi:MAG: hypothetical protein WC979_02895 [Candidatus Pacearchaeota archaeon]|jgi:hypothetical protein|nr:hypothetical protein [Clostridia bacterium]